MSVEATASSKTGSKPRAFRRGRQGLSAQGEVVLAHVVQATGFQAGARALTEAWPQVHGPGPVPTQVAKRSWREVLAPGLQAGRVVATGQREFRTYRPSNVDAAPPPRTHGPRRFGAARRRLSEQGEVVVGYVSTTTGYQADATALSQAWPEVHPGTPPREVQEGRWSRILHPALQEGRIVSERSGRRLFYRPASLPSALPPPRKPRVFGPERLRVSAQAEAVITYVATTTGHAVLARDLAGEWPVVHGEPFPEAFRGRIRRLLLPGVGAGRVRVAMRGQRLLVRPADLAHLPDPEWITDEDRVLEAVRRAVRALRGAVPLERVEAEIEADPRLRQCGKIRVSDVLANLKRRGRLEALRTHPRLRVPQQYYTLPGQPLEVPAAARTQLDRRLDIIRGMWSATGGLPFTTRAIRRRARRGDPERFEDEPWWAWTAALHHLAESGVLVKLRRARRRYALWAPARAWEALAPEERDRRLTDLLRGPSGLPLVPSRQLARQLMYDPNEVSRNNDMRALFILARRCWIDRAANPATAELYHRRPLSVQDVADVVAPDHPLFPSLPLVLAMEEAARLRNGMVRSELVALNVGGRLCHYDLCETSDALAFQAFLKAREAVRPDRLTRQVDELLEGAAKLPTRAVNLPPDVLAHQADTLRRQLERLDRALRTASRKAPLLAEEVQETSNLRRTLSTLLGRVQAIAGQLPPPEPSPSPRTPPVHAIEDAWIEIQPLAGYPLAKVRELPNRLPHVPVVRPPGGVAKPDGPGRPPETQFDRIAFVLHVSHQWGGSVLRYLSGLAASAIGPIRTSSPLVQALESADPGAHRAAAAGLGFLDDGAARQALVGYLRRYLDGCSDSPATAVAAEFAVWGLAPLPFAPAAKALAPAEETTLEALARTSPDERVRTAAARVLGFWRGVRDPDAELDFYGPPPAGGDRWPPPPYGTSANQAEARKDAEPPRGGGAGGDAADPVPPPPLGPSAPDPGR